MLEYVLNVDHLGDRIPGAEITATETTSIFAVKIDVVSVAVISAPGIRSPTSQEKKQIPNMRNLFILQGGWLGYTR